MCGERECRTWDGRIIISLPCRFQRIQSSSSTQRPQRPPTVTTHKPPHAIVAESPRLILLLRLLLLLLHRSSLLRLLLIHGHIALCDQLDPASAQGRRSKQRKPDSLQHIQYKVRQCFATISHPAIQPFSHPAKYSDERGTSSCDRTHRTESGVCSWTMSSSRRIEYQST